MGDQDGQGAHQPHQLRIRFCQVGRQQNDDSVSPGQSNFQRFAHRTGREDPAPAKGPFFVAGLAIHHDQREGLLHRRVLVAVIHDDEDGPGLSRRDGARRPVPGYPDAEVVSQHQRLVADLGGGVLRRVDAQRPGLGAAIAARQYRAAQPPGDFPDHRRLAGAAHREVSHADHRHTRIDRLSGGDPSRRHGGPDPRKRRQKQSSHRACPAQASAVPPARCRELHAGNRGSSWTSA